MNRDTVSTLKRLIVRDLYVPVTEEEIGIDDGLRTVVGLDSLGFIELRVLCEQHFNVVISDEDYTPENFTSIRRVANFIERLQGAPALTR
jgi:acyl carrier protein